MSKPQSKEEKNPFAAFAANNILGKVSPIEVITDGAIVEDEENVIKDEEFNFDQELEKEQKTKTKVKEDVLGDIPDEVKQELESGQIKDKTQEEEQNDDFSYKPLIEKWSEKGLIDFDEEEFKDEDFSQDEILDKLQERTLNKRFEKKLEQYPEKLRKAVEWVENGGDIDQFYDYYYNNIRYADIEMTSEDSELQKAILKDYLRSQGEEDETRLNNKIEKYELSGILEDEAEDALNKLRKSEKVAEEQKELTQKAKAEENKNRQLKEWNDLKKAVLETEEIAGFKITPKVREELWNHMTKPVDKSGKTKLQINNETKGLQAKLVYAYLDMLNFDVTKLEKQVKTKVTSDLRAKLGKYSDRKTGMGSLSKTEINEDNPFEGFKRSI